MSMRRIAALQAGLLLVAMVGNAAAVKNATRIKVLDSETRSLSPGDNGVPKDCDQITFDAYCRSARAVPLVNTLLVQEDDGPPFHISCTAESKFSRCMPLPKGASFDARREKKGITVYYVDDQGKARKQLYTLVDTGEKGATATATAVATQPVAAASSRQQDPPAPAQVPSAGTVQQVSREKVSEKIKCNFSSTPPGAEITIDGKYAGSTPSVLSLATGSHLVVMSMPGFGQWKRDLTVSAGSELTINAVLERAP